MLKLNIQRFASTNQTTHYELSQYVSSDKPTYLVDYNGDMNKIDTAIYSADARSLVNEGAIGDLTELDTTAKTDLVSAINEVAGETDTNTSDITSLNTSVSANTGNIGTMANLQTTAKDNLVNAVNEVKGVNDTQNTNIASLQDEIEKFNLTVVKNYTPSSPSSDLTVSDVVGSARLDGANITIATDSTGSIFKFYGFVRCIGPLKLTFKNTGINPTSGFDIYGAGIIVADNSAFYTGSIKVLANGDIEFTNSTDRQDTRRSQFFPCIYFAKDFGDQPE